METIDTTKFMDASKFDWATYYSKGKESLKKELEENQEMFDNWTASNGKFDKYNRYRLVTYFMIVENDVDNHPSGTVTGHLKCFMDAASIEELEQLWNSKFWKSRYNTTHQHFIADMIDRKIVKFLSVCM